MLPIGRLFLVESALYREENGENEEFARPEAVLLDFELPSPYY